MDLIGAYVLVVLGIGIAVLVVAVMLQQRRSPQSAVAWLLFIVTLPYVGVPVFLLLGFRKHGGRFAPIRYTRSDAPPPDDRGFGALMHHFDLPPATDGNRVTLHGNPESARRALQRIIATATERIDASFYILENDEAGHRFVQLLTQRAQSGVKVRLILDWLGSMSRPRKALRALAEAGGEIRFQSPLVHRSAPGHMNLRNHRKMVIADRARVWAGGRNVGMRYFVSAPDVWSDLSYEVEGPALQAFLDVFVSDWEISGAPSGGEIPTAVTTPAGHDRVQLVPSGPDVHRDPLHDGLIYAIHAARTRVYLATPYYMPPDALALALATAARRGLDVRLIIPEKSNQKLADFARGAYLRDLADTGCRILRFQPGMMHAKAGIFDDLGWVGSANLDVRSMLLNFEAVLMIHGGAGLSGLERWFDRVQSDCEEGLKHAGLVRRVGEGVFRLGAPLL